MMTPDNSATEKDSEADEEEEQDPKPKDNKKKDKKRRMANGAKDSSDYSINCPDGSDTRY